MRYKYLLQKQVKNRGCYASIEFGLKRNEVDDYKLEINYCANPKWEIICKAGIVVFNDYYRKHKGGSLVINVLSIDYLPVDSNNLIIFYATIKGLSEALNIKIEKLYFDEQIESFIFPELRTR